MLNDKKILVTGGTGSFGKKFIEIVLKKYPRIKKIIIFSRDEFKQFHMAHADIFKQHADKLRFFIGDVRDPDRLYRALDGVDIVIHAAALKQVPSCEYNPFEAVKTNIFGAENVINASIDKGVKKVVALSTDKACAPINLYGATKLCSDKLFISGNSYSGKHKARFSVVRYGNVVGSRGSVIPLFKKIISEGKNELPITDFNMTRFWLNFEQAAEMVITALKTMQGGELFVRKIPSMKITDLAKALLPNAKLKKVGIRPGEKIHEMMISKEDARNTVEFDDYYVVQPEFHWWKKDFTVEGGKPVPQDFEYHSGNNTKWLSIEQLRKMTEKVSIEDSYGLVEE